MVERFAISHVAVIEDAVANQALGIIGEHRAVEQMGLFLGGVVSAEGGVDVVAVALDVGRTYDGGHLCLGVVEQGVGGEHEVGVGEGHLIVEKLR